MDFSDVESGSYYTHGIEIEIEIGTGIEIEIEIEIERNRNRTHMQYDRKEQLIDEEREWPDKWRFSDMFFSELIRVLTTVDQFLLLPVVCERTIASRIRW